MMRYGAMQAFEPRAPLPTPGPSLALLNRRLGIRDDADITCGWIVDTSEEYTQAMVCATTESCAGATEDGASVTGCCDATACNFATSCMDYSDYHSLSGASLPIWVVPCTGQDQPFCAEVQFADSYTTFICDQSHAVYTGFETFDILPSAAISTDASSPTTTESLHISSTSTTSTPTTTSPPAPAASSSPLSTGAIAAIAIAGTAVVIAICLTVFFMRRSKQKRANAELTRANILEKQVRDSQGHSIGRWTETTKVADPASYPAEYDNQSTVDGTVYQGKAPRV